MLRKFELKVEKAGLRFDQFLALQFPSVSLTKLRNAIKHGEARLNGRKTFSGWILQQGDDITIELDPGEPTSATAENIPLDIVYEDDDVIIINKQVNLLSHPSANEKSGTVLNALAYYFLNKGTSGARPILLHRLDRDTSGILAIAKNERAGRIISKAFRDRRVHKRYTAIVSGTVAADDGEIVAPIARQAGVWPRWGVRGDGEPSITKYHVARRWESHTLLELEPLTGKTHQLRIHCAHLGHPIVGEQVYKGEGWTEIPGLTLKHQLLHAQMLSFRLPSNGEEKEFIAPWPETFRQALLILDKSR